MPSKAYSAQHYWLALKLIPRLGARKKITLVEEYGIQKLFTDALSVLKNKVSTTQYQAFLSPDWARIDKIIAQSKHCNSDIIHYESSNYPRLLKEIYDPPLILFVQGDTQLLNMPQLGVVGSRSATPYGRENAYALAKSLMSYDVVITSGLALGIDAAAHKGALDGNGKTIAVVASGLDIVYPTRHKPLCHQIIEQGGVIVSEFVPGTLPKAGLFPRRNRIISGMSQGVLVVEAEIKSGSLITARCALEHNREVFALPNSINNPQAKGCHWLIKQGAKLIEEAADIVEELELILKDGLNLKEIKNKGKEINKSQKEDLLIDSLLDSVGYEITPVDVVVSRSELSIEVVLTRLTMLELRGLVSAVPGGYLRVN